MTSGSLGGQAGAGGQLDIKVIRGKGSTKKRLMVWLLSLVLVQHLLGLWERRAILREQIVYRLKNQLRWRFMVAAFWYRMAFVFGKVTPFTVLVSELRGELIRKDGTRIDLGVLCYRNITNAFLAAVVDDLDNGAADISGYNFHGVGIGTTAEAASQTALVTESTTILTTDSVRATGTRSQPTAPQYRTVGTPAFDGSGAITEHAVFNDADVGEGTMMDRSLFSAINVVSGDSIQFTYTLTLAGD